MFVGEEAPGNGSLLNSSNGDIHVVDVSNMAAPREVAFYHVDDAGTHNFSVDEQRGILYAAYYNAGVRALDVRGDLSTCTADQKSADGRCDLKKMGRELAAGLQDAGSGVRLGRALRRQLRVRVGHGERPLEARGARPTVAIGVRVEATIRSGMSRRVRPGFDALTP